jgi:S1-C subfamily serine protease/Tfp pilus assembly protein PilF
MKLRKCCPVFISVLLFCYFPVLGQKKVATYYNVKGYTEQTARAYYTQNQIDPIEGIWQSNDGFKYAIEKDVRNGIRTQDNYRIIILSHNTSNTFWQTSYIKGFIEKTAVNGVYNIDYYTAAKNYYNQMDIQVQTCIGLLESTALLSFTRQDGAKIMLIRLFPKTNEAISGGAANVSTATGTGFAIHAGGYIVTNHHVIENAQTIEVKGVQGNFNKKWPAELLVTDEKNDLAIIQIKDARFTGLGNIPFGWRQGTAEVGENVFVLGYPMTSSMGEEVKLTNGIISSRTGFKGDISTYQVSAPVQPGNSGGPLFDKNGQIIGIVNARHAKAENASYAIKAGYLKSLLELLPQPLQLPYSNQLQGKPLTDQVKSAAPFVYLIVVNDPDTPQQPKEKNKPAVSSGSTELAAALYSQAEALWKKQDARGALEKINQSIEASGDYAGSFYFRGFVYFFGIMQYQKALEDFTRTIQMQPNMEWAYFYRGMCYDKLTRNPEAIADFTKALQLNPDNTDAYFMRGYIKSISNDLLGSINDYGEILHREKTTKPGIYKMGTIYNNMGYSLMQLGKLDEAKGYLDRAVDMEPKESYIWGSRGELYYKREDYKACIRNMEKAVELAEKTNTRNSDPGLPHYLMGLSKIKLGKVTEGCKDLSRAGEMGKTAAYNAISTYCK